jgi:hypothetical protein
MNAAVLKYYEIEAAVNLKWMTGAKFMDSEESHNMRTWNQVS